MSALRRLARRFPDPVRIRLARAAERAEPGPVLLRWRMRRQPCPPLDLVTIYRGRNADTVAGLLAAAGAPVRTALWALDAPTPGLAALTVGTGPGLRTALLNRLVEALELPDRAWLVVADDDVALRAGTLADLVKAAAASGFDVAQPAHASGSRHSWPINARRRLTLSRATRFVESGPVVVFSPRARAACFPLPEELGMGWGTEAVWGTRTELGTGIVDAFPVMHLGHVGADYDTTALDPSGGATGRRLLSRVGARRIEDLQVELGRWRPWQRTPAWARRAPAARDRPATALDRR